MPTLTPPEPTPPELSLKAPAEILGLLREIRDKGLVLTLAAPDGGHYSTTLAAIDTDSQSLSFSANTVDRSLHLMVETGDVIAVAYLDRIKLQFQLANPLLVNGVQGSTLRADLPQEIFRFQRRSAYRVQPLDTTAPRATLPHPNSSGQHLYLRILDVSASGVALLAPAELVVQAPWQVGALIAPVQLQLDRSTHLELRLRVQHVSLLAGSAGGVQLGCAFDELSTLAARDLQRYIDQTQKRRRVLQTR